MEGESKFYTQEQAEKEASKKLEMLSEKYPEQEGAFSTEQYEKAEAELREQQLQLIENLTSNNAPGFLIGGYASDLLISGEFNNPHTDVDMAVLRENEDEVREKLSRLGYRVNEKIENDPNNPHKLYLTDAGPLKGDFALVDIDPKTHEPFIEVKLKDNSVVNLFFSEDMFSAEPVLFDGKSLKVVSPRSLIQTLLFYSQIDRAQTREKDLVRAQQLVDKYFPEETVESEIFKVRIENVVRDLPNKS